MISLSPFRVKLAWWEVLPVSLYTTEILCPGSALDKLSSKLLVLIWWRGKKARVTLEPTLCFVNSFLYFPFGPELSAFHHYIIVSIKLQPLKNTATVSSTAVLFFASWPSLSCIKVMQCIQCKYLDVLVIDLVAFAVDCCVHKCDPAFYFK